MSAKCSFGPKELGLEGQSVEERRVEYTLKLGAAEIWALLRHVQAAPKIGASSVTITFRVPGGGDCSNEDIALDNGEQVVTVSWTMTEKKP